MNLHKHLKTTRLVKLRYLVVVMELIEDFPEGLTEKQIKDYNPNLYPYFSQYCLGGSDALARQMPNGCFKLTQKGVRKLDDLRSRYHMEDHHASQRRTNKLIAAGGAIVALYYIYILGQEFSTIVNTVGWKTFDFWFYAAVLAGLTAVAIFFVDNIVKIVRE